MAMPVMGKWVKKVNGKEGKGSWDEREREGEGRDGNFFQPRHVCHLPFDEL